MNDSTYYKNEISRAARMFDETQPGWADNFNLESFNIGDVENCIIGQIFNCEFGSGEFARKYYEFIEKGFCGDIFGTVTGFPIEEMWETEILNRRKLSSIV